MNSQNLNLQLPDKTLMLNQGKRLLGGNDEAQRQAQKPPAQAAETPISWLKLEQKDGTMKLKAVANVDHVDVTTVALRDQEVSAPKTVSFLGYKIDLKAKVDSFKDNYVKNYAQTKSHNLMVARFAELKAAFFGYLLGMVGLSSEDIRKLQKQAIEGAVNQNKMLFEENEYNAELLGIIGGSKKQLRAQEKVIGEIRKQLVTQAKNLGLGDYYTSRRILEIQVEQCRKISAKFEEEKHSLEYQL